MDLAYLSALTALAGSVTGGLTTDPSTQRAQTRTALLAHKISKREDLSPDFIVAASKTHGEAIVSNEPQLPDLAGLYAMIGRMRVLCSAGESATATGRVTIDNSDFCDRHNRFDRNRNRE